MTPAGATWDPYDPSYSLIQESRLDINSNILAPKYVNNILVQHNEEQTVMLSSLNVVLADDMWRNDMFDYSPGETCAILRPLPKHI